MKYLVDLSSYNTQKYVKRITLNIRSDEEMITIAKRFANNYLTKVYNETTKKFVFMYQ